MSKIDLKKLWIGKNDEPTEENEMADGEVIEGLDAEEAAKSTLPEVLPILPLRNMVMFPSIVMPINVGRESSLRLMQQAYKQGGMIGVVTQREAGTERPGLKDLYEVGTAAVILKLLEMPDGTTTAVVQGLRRFRLEDILYDDPFPVGKVEKLEERPVTMDDQEWHAIGESLKEMAGKIARHTNLGNEFNFALEHVGSLVFFVNFLASSGGMEYAEKQALLEMDDLKQRAIRLLELLGKQLKILELKEDIQKKVKTDLDKQQREYFLQQQMRTIQNELGSNPGDEDITELENAAKEKKWTKEVKAAFDKELEKLKRQNPNTPDYSVQYNYVKELTELPWGEYSTDNFDLKKAGEILDSEHYGLEKVKERILEYLAVLKLKGDMKSPILCLYGPPGVGKTSLGRSVARALGRQFARVSLGGLHDEAEIRGHRRTYIGAMPGRIIQGIKKAGTSNPVFVLDEIDKVGNDFRGDPQSALLEVLDPEQNGAFHDNYLDIDYDLSRVMFIATANDISTIAPPLRDRMEMIEMSGYLLEEKREIAKRHLIPRQLENHGLKPEQVEIPDETLNYIIDKYTRESGVRGLDKTLAKVMRRVARQVAMDDGFHARLTRELVKEYLGRPIFTREEYQGNELPGVVTGLAWTAAGGEILFIESSVSKGKGNLTMTGSLGDVMKESATLALQYIKAHAGELGIDPKAVEEHDIHIHVPAGAVPKDGPSAGITIVTSLASSLTGRKVKKALAMTGEITLRGKVLPVGGIREKILAAKRAGIKEIVLCSENRKDIEEIKKEYVRGLKFHYVDHIQEVLDIALI